MSDAPDTLSVAQTPVNTPPATHVDWGLQGPPPPSPLIRQNALNLRDLGDVVRKLSFEEEDD